MKQPDRTTPEGLLRFYIKLKLLNIYCSISECRLYFYEKMLRDYKRAKILNVLTLGQYSWMSRYMSYCQYLKAYSINIYTDLPELCSTHPYRFCGYWFPPGALTPRINLLKQVINQMKSQEKDDNTPNH